jgi:predicted peptidase
MRNRISVCLLLAAVIMNQSIAATPLPASSDIFEARVFKDAEEKMLPYRLLRPIDADPNTHYPIVLFFHGAGERGSDNVRQLKNAVGVFGREENRLKFPCYVLVPQCQSQSMWVDTPWTLDAHIQPAKPTEPMRLAMELLASIQKEFNIDAKRIYVAGVSMGGFGTWDAITRYPGIFAAAVPCCGGADEHTAAIVKDLPIWAFHGDKDTVVKTIRSQHMIEAIKKAGGDPRYTEYKDVPHDSWTKAFNDPELLSWLFAQTKK